jgi:ubiquinone/menaquinone biosynthesis C-methylase UbiE
MGLIGNLIYSTISSKEKVEKYQQIIRDAEWTQIENHIAKKSKFLDVGCGAGYSLMKASEDLDCKAVGIDPDPGAHGVGRFVKELVNQIEIKQGFAENLPFADNSFDVVYSSHVLEHVNDEVKALDEMKRVLKKDGVLVIGMPTSNMAFLNYFSQFIFTTHIKIYEFIRNIFSISIFKNGIKIFRILSHSYPRAKSIWYDIFHYRTSKWKKTIGKEFEIKNIVNPYLYPYPDYPQFFKLHKNYFFSSSVFFICSKK